MVPASGCNDFIVTSDGDVCNARSSKHNFFVHLEGGLHAETSYRAHYRTMRKKLIAADTEAEIPLDIK